MNLLHLGKVVNLCEENTSWVEDTAARLVPISVCDSVVQINPSECPLITPLQHKRNPAHRTSSARSAHLPSTHQMDLTDSITPPENIGPLRFYFSLVNIVAYTQKLRPPKVIDKQTTKVPESLRETIRAQNALEHNMRP